MATPNFFCDTNALDYLLGMGVTHSCKDINLTIDVVDLPYYLLFNSDAASLTVKVMQRGEIYQHDETSIQRGKVVVNRKTGDGEIHATPELAEIMKSFPHVCLNIAKYIQDNGLESVYADFDPEQEGIQLYVENNKLKYKVVAGNNRPELMCVTLRGEYIMTRPYWDDFVEQSAISIEDIIKDAEAGDIESIEKLALLYTSGDGATEPNPEKAVYWVQKLADAGSSNGMYNLGLHYAKGYGVARDFEQAAYWMGRAADAGDTDAVAPEKEYRKAADAYKKAIAGDPQGQADYASALMAVGGSLSQADNTPDYKESIQWAQKSEGKDNGESYFVLALAYEKGRGVNANTQKAAEYYKKGAEKGHEICANNLGLLYMTGNGVPKNQEKAFLMFLKSAELGYGLAMQNVGRCYEFGDGTERNLEKAVEWYEKSLAVLPDEEIDQRIANIKKHQASVAKRQQQAIKKKQNQLKEVINQNKNQLDDLIKQKKETDKKIYELSAELESLIAKSSTENDITSFFDEIIQEREAQISQIEKRLNELAQEKREKIGTVEELENEIATLSRFKGNRKKQCLQEIENISKDIQIIKEKVRELEDKEINIIKAEEKKIAALQNNHDNDKKKADELKVELDSTLGKQKILNEEIEQLRCRIKQRENELNNWGE